MFSSRRSPWISVVPRSASASASGVASPTSSSTASPTSASTASPNASQAASNCFGRMSTSSRSRSESAGAANARRSARRRQVRQLLVPEPCPHLGRAGQHEAVLLARERGGLVEQLVAHVAHHDPPRVALRLGRDDGGVHAPPAAREDAVGEQERLAAGVARGAPEPVGARHDPLRDQRAAVGEHEPVDAVARPAARGERACARRLCRARRTAPRRPPAPAPRPARCAAAPCRPSGAPRSPAASRCR